MAITLPGLFATPQDIFDYIGVDAAQLRLDDNNKASGQTIQTTSAGVIGDTSLSIVALQYPLLAGTHLVFVNENPPVEVTVAAITPVGSITLSVVALGAAIGIGGQAIDNGGNVWLASLMVKACTYATTQVQAYCSPRYDFNQLLQNASIPGSVNRWATTLASRWLAKRRFQAAPVGIESDYEEAMAELKMVRSGQFNVENVPPRTSSWPFISNLSIIDRYTYKARVQPAISEGTPTQFAQLIDWNGIFAFYEW
jgi:hypothetical protein